VFCFLDSFELESSLSLVFLNLAPSRNHFLWFGHLVGPIMGVFCLARRLFLLFHLCIFFHHMATSEGVLPTSEGGLPTSEGVIPTSEGVINAKQGNLREIKGLFCTYQHVANTKFAPKCVFCPKNALFWRQIRFLLLPNRDPHPQGGILVPRDYGPADQNPAWGLEKEMICCT
jgi:hypothetical protein